MRLFELHPSDHTLLTANFNGQAKQVQIAQQDGFAGIKACLPPPPRRAVALIDPPYEDKQDYQRVVALVKDSLKRFASGTYLIWYPILQRPEPGEMIQELMGLHAPNWLHVSLSIHAPNTDGYGMHGSGLFILNPPWTLAKDLATTLPSLCQLLALDDSAHFTLDHEMA
jgi:23S rRNA (adenine2030-N6)-methyltransferase